MSRLLFVPAVLVALFACSKEELEMCTDIAVSSLSLTIVDAAGNALPGATVTYRVEEGEPQPCESVLGDGTFVCGYEVAGELVVTATAEGFSPAEVAYTVAADECHVITVVDTIALEPLVCTTEARASIQVSIIDGDVPGDAAVTYRNVDTDGTGVPCERVALGDYVCGWEEEGTFEVVATAESGDVASETVTVEGDECHVTTEQITLLVNPMNGG